MSKHFYIVSNGRGDAVCTTDGEITFVKPNPTHTNVVRHYNREYAEKLAERVNKMLGSLQRYKTDSFKPYWVYDRTGDCEEAFNFICDFAKRYMAYTFKDHVDLCLSTSETALVIDGSRYYSVRLTENGFQCGRWYKCQKFDKEEFTLDNVKVIMGNGSKVPPIMFIQARIKDLYRDLLRDKQFKQILEKPRFKTAKEKAQWLLDNLRYNKNEEFCLGKSLPYIAEMVAKVFGDEYVEIKADCGLVCKGSADKIAWETDRLMPYPQSKEHINNEDATTLYYGSRHIGEKEWLPFLANASRYHIGSFDINDKGIAVFQLTKGLSEDVLMC